MTARSTEISVVLATPRGLDAIRRTLHHLRKQTVRDRIELIIVAQSPLSRVGESGLDGFAGLRLVDVGPLASTGAAFAAGVRAASAPIVGCAEEHSFPEPGWAEALIAAHTGPWAAVGGVLENANPASRASWAQHLIDFGPAVAPAASGEASELPGHHTTYKRDALLSFGPDLDRMLEIEWVLHDKLRASGKRLFRESRAVSRHLHASRLRSYLNSQFHGGRSFAANRAHIRGWSLLRRLVWVAGSPLTPVVRLVRSLPDVRRAYPGRRAGLVPVLALGLVANAAGQMLGYALGQGPATVVRLSFELDRHRHLTDDEQAALASTPLTELPRLTASSR